MILTGDSRSSRDTNLSHCHFVNHSSYMEQSKIKIGPLADRPGTGCTKAWPKDKSKQPQVRCIKHQKGLHYVGGHGSNYVLMRIFWVLCFRL